MLRVIDLDKQLTSITPVMSGMYLDVSAANSSLPLKSNWPQ